MSKHLVNTTHLTHRIRITMRSISLATLALFIGVTMPASFAQTNSPQTATSPKVIAAKPKPEAHVTKLTPHAIPKQREQAIPLSSFQAKKSTAATGHRGVLSDEFLSIFAAIAGLMTFVMLGLSSLKSKSGNNESSPINTLGKRFGLSTLNLGSKNTSVSKTESDYYKFKIVQRQSIGQGRELLTVHQAGQWFLLGSTPNQIQFLANLTPTQTGHSDQAPTTPSSELGFASMLQERESLESLFNKYIPPLEMTDTTDDLLLQAEASRFADIRQQLSHGAKTNATAPSVSDIPDDAVLEIHLPDYEDVFSPSPLGVPMASNGGNDTAPTYLI